MYSALRELLTSEMGLPRSQQEVQRTKHRVGERGTRVLHTTQSMMNAPTRVNRVLWHDKLAVCNVARVLQVLAKPSDTIEITNRSATITTTTHLWQTALFLPHTATQVALKGPVGIAQLIELVKVAPHLCGCGIGGQALDHDPVVGCANTAGGSSELCVSAWAGSSKQASERREEQRTRCHVVGICFLDHAVNLGANKEDEADEEEAAHHHANKSFSHSTQRCAGDTLVLLHLTQGGGHRLLGCKKWSSHQ